MSDAALIVKKKDRERSSIRVMALRVHDEVHDQTHARQLCSRWLRLARVRHSSFGAVVGFCHTSDAT